MSLTLPQQEIRMASMLPIKITTNKRKSFAYRILTISVFMLFSSLVLITGCGGGGGGDDSVGVSPTDEEIKVVLNRLSTSINAANTAEVMSVFDSQIKYYKPSTPWKEIYHGDVEKEMENFLSKATQISMKFDYIVIRYGSEDSATVNSLLTGTYTDQSGVSKSFSEEVEMLLEKVGTWGINKFYKNDNGPTGSNFPPTL